ncbi:MAG: hypothetical protein ACI35S_09190, partial [Anaeroplasma sp.]
MLKNVLYLKLNNCDSNELLKLKNELENKGYILRISEGFSNSSINEKNIRVSILRSDIIIIFINEKTLLNEYYYTDYELIDKYNKNSKPILFLILDNDLDSMYEKIYRDDDYSDDMLINADDHKEIIKESNYVCFNNVDNLVEKLFSLGIVSSTEESKEEITEEVKEEVTEESKDEITDEVKEEITEEVKEEITEEVKEEITEEVKEEIT